MRDTAGRGTATIAFPNIPLLKGEYFVGVYLLSENGIHIYDGAANVATLHFSQSSLEQGVVSLPHAWQSAVGAVAPGEPANLSVT
jgi:lipopolysaccharide transport system ATP-binding protein